MLARLSKNPPLLSKIQLHVLVMYHTRFTWSFTCYTVILLKNVAGKVDTFRMLINLLMLQLKVMDWYWNVCNSRFDHLKCKLCGFLQPLTACYLSWCNQRNVRFFGIMRNNYNKTIVHCIRLKTNNKQCSSCQVNKI